MDRTHWKQMNKLIHTGGHRKITVIFLNFTGPFFDSYSDLGQSVKSKDLKIVLSTSCRLDNVSVSQAQRRRTRKSKKQSSPK